MKPGGTHSAAGCTEALIYLYDFLTDEASGSVPPEQASHIRRCPSCQAKLRELERLLEDPAGGFQPGTHERNAAIVRLLRSHLAYLNRPVGCSDVKVFLPSLANPLLAISRPTPITAHIDRCSACSADLETIRGLGLTPSQLSGLTGFLANGEPMTGIDAARQTLISIAHRPASGVVTCMRLPEQPDDAARSEEEPLHADWRVDVQVLRQTPACAQEGPEPPFSHRFPRERAIATLRRLPRWAAVAAAVLVVGYAMFLSTAPAQAVTLKQLYEALQRAGNVCIASILPNAAEPRHKEWVSRSLNLSVLEGVHDGREACALWDMSNRTIRLKYLEDGQVEIREMSDEVFARGQKHMTYATGLVPFDEITDLPEGSTWEKVADPNVTMPLGGTQAYDLVWTTPIPTIPPTRETERWRFFVDPHTHLPARLEMYSQAPNEPQPRLHKTLVITYPSDQEIRSLVQTLFPDFQIEAQAPRS